MVLCNYSKSKKGVNAVNILNAFHYQLFFLVQLIFRGNLMTLKSLNKRAKKMRLLEQSGKRIQGNSHRIGRYFSKFEEEVAE